MPWLIWALIGIGALTLGIAILILAAYLMGWAANAGRIDAWLDRMKKAKERS